jgi:NTE family protein
MLRLPDDIAGYGQRPDDLPVADAVRMSMSIPLFYEPVVLKDGQGRSSYVVDGGLLSNFPVWIFDDQTNDPPWPTFGFRLVEGKPEPNEIDGPITFLKAMVSTMLHAHDERYVKDADFVRTIAVDTVGVGTTDFGLRAEQRDALFESGRAAAKEFLSEWSFDTYKERFRRREVPRRGARLRRDR